MSVLIQKHREAPVWKIYDENKSYLGQILGTDKESMPELAKKISELLLGAEDTKYKKEKIADGSLNIYEVATGKRVGGFEKNFSALGEAIQGNLK